MNRRESQRRRESFTRSQRIRRMIFGRTWMELLHKFIEAYRITPEFRESA